MHTEKAGKTALPRLPQPQPSLSHGPGPGPVSLLPLDDPRLLSIGELACHTPDEAALRRDRRAVGVLIEAVRARGGAVAAVLPVDQDRERLKKEGRAKKARLFAALEKGLDEILVVANAP